MFAFTSFQFTPPTTTRCPNDRRDKTGAVDDNDHRKSNGIMRLTIIAPENVHEVEVDSAMEVQDVQGLAEAEVSHTLQLGTAA